MQVQLSLDKRNDNGLNDSPEGRLRSFINSTYNFSLVTVSFVLLFLGVDYCIMDL